MSETAVHFKAIFYSTLFYYITFAFVILMFHCDVTMCGVFFFNLFIWFRINHQGSSSYYLLVGNINRYHCFAPIFFLICLFIYFWLHWVFIAACGLQLRQVGDTLRCGAWPSHCGGFSCCGAWALGTQVSVVVARGLSSCGTRVLERRLSSCGAQAQLLCGMWDLPRAGLEPMSPALAGGFLTTVPPGKPMPLF